MVFQSLNGLKASLTWGILKKILRDCVITLLVLGFFLENVQLLISNTHSLPYTYFLNFPYIKPGRGDLTTFYHPSGARLIKRIAGEEGDILSYDENNVLWVSGIRIGIPKNKDRHGNSLVSTLDGKIPDGFVFLFAPHEDSLDSRYTKVGLIYEKHLGGTAIALF